MNDQYINREIAFSQPVINIGADSGNDIVLRGKTVADFHVMLHFDHNSNRWFITALNEGTHTTVNGRPVGMDPVSLQNGSLLGIGEYRLTLNLNGINTDIIIQQSNPNFSTDSGSDSDQSMQNIILAVTEAGVQEVEAGGLVEYGLTVTNAGPLVANMQLQVQGIPTAWVQIIPPVLNLNEGRKGLFTVRITPPRDSSAEAGLYNLHFVAISPNYQRETGTADSTLTVLPFSEFLVNGPSPRSVKLKKSHPESTTDLVIINNSNTRSDFFVRSYDDANDLVFSFDHGAKGLVQMQDTVSIRPGDSERVQIRIGARKLPFFGGAAKHHNYNVTVTPADRPNDTQTVIGEVQIGPMINTIWVLLFLLLAVGILLFALQPYIYSFGGPDGKRSQVILSGGSAWMSWDVSIFSEKTTIDDGSGPVEVSRSGNMYMTPSVSTTYTLKSENFLSRLLNFPHESTLKVMIIPRRPTIDMFTIDNTQLLYNAETMVRWAVGANADKVSLVANKQATELAKENYSGESKQGFVTDTLMYLNAENESGYEMKSLFVNVAKDAITLNRFTVWVRPNGVAVPSDNDTRRTTRWGSLVTSLTGNVNPRPMEQSNTLDIPDDFSAVGSGTGSMNPEQILLSGESPVPGSSVWVVPTPTAVSGDLLVSPNLSPTATPNAGVESIDLTSYVPVTQITAPDRSPEGNSYNRDFSVKLVEAVEDPLADSGYRVVDYFPDYVLQKGEQILIEWNVGGVTTVTIENLASDALQNTGGEYVYPEKSITYTLNAEVGETKKVFSLPVRVQGDGDDGEGSGLNCELKANATTLKVPGTIMLTWTGAGSNRVQLISSTKAEEENKEAEKKAEDEAKAKGETYEKKSNPELSGGVIGDWLQPSGFMRVNVDQQTTFMLKAYDGNGNVICSKTAEVKYEGGNDKADLKFKIETITDTEGIEQPEFAVGQTIQVTVSLSDYQKGKDPSGTIAVSDGVSTCSMTYPVTMCSFQAKKTGTLKVTAVYSGDDNYKKQTSQGWMTVIDKVKTETSIPTAPVKTAANLADVDVQIKWDAETAYYRFPDGIVTLTIGSGTCDIDFMMDTSTCGGVVTLSEDNTDGLMKFSVQGLVLA
ncbi:MAG: FHA domain-containing protein, partial [Anaerolineaceae bacterium]|nr:FHA domain-containing protein [Anaerolineaceae bacterium]